MSGSNHDGPAPATDADPREHLRHALDHAAHLLPVQGPIGVFVHHNTLHAFEHLAFEDAVVEAGRLFGAEPFMPEAWYRDALDEGRITLEDLDAALAEDSPDGASLGLDDSLFGGRIDRRELRRRVLVQARLEADDASIDWWLEEQGLGRRFMPGITLPARVTITGETTPWLSSALRSGALSLEALADPLRGVPASTLVRRWMGVEPSPAGIERALQQDPEACAVACLWVTSANRTQTAAHTDRDGPSDSAPVRLRDLVLAATGRDPDELVDAVLVPAISAFVDQGVAYWPMPDRAKGFHAAFVRLVREGPPLPVPLLTDFRRSIGSTPAEAEDALIESLETLGLSPAEWSDTLEAAAQALPGWAGIMRCLEEHPELAPHECPPCRLVDFLAVRLRLDTLAALRIAREELDHRGSAMDLRTRLGSVVPPKTSLAPSAFALFELAQMCGISAPALRGLSADEVQAVRAELAAFDHVARRRVWHLAYERNHRLGVLGPMARHRQRTQPARDRGPVPPIQAAFCIDEREESLRRHLEEHDPEVETFGAAGFFGLAIAFRGLDDGHHAPLCPVAQQPQHEILEVGDDDDRLPRYTQRRRMLAGLLRGSFFGSRNLLRGAVATFGLGLLSLVPMTLEVLSPHTLERLAARLRAMFLPRPRTRLALRRAAEERNDLELFPGFTVPEMADRIGRLLEDIGLVRRFAPLVAIIGHGSSSLNNPHESAHDCGACGGGRGGPNARLFALMANEPEVRAELRSRGLELPDDTTFVGGYHDTCNDAITWYDLERVPARHAESLVRLRAGFEYARTMDAHERCRRFESVPLDVEPAAALAHVQARAVDLAQPRPEYGHATNAVCVFGRRGLTRGLFLDRRAFLVSYDPSVDPEGEVLGRLLAAMGPVGAGINLEYYFSFVDNERYGCGTKLPHNVTALVGVMNGHGSDLRTGLPWQMVEIHEPVRLLCVVESTAELIGRIAERHPAVGTLVANRWIQLALIHPETGVMTMHDRGSFVPLPEPLAPLPEVARSEQWYRARREHLPIAVITAGTRTSA